MSHETRIIWLKAAAILLIVIGVVFSWGTFGAIQAGGLAFLDLAVWPFDGQQTFAATETRLLAAIVGGLTVGLGALIYVVTTEIYTKNPELGRRLILAFIIPWFVIDSVGSVIAGAPFNALINLGVLIPVGLPLLISPARQTA